MLTRVQSANRSIYPRLQGLKCGTPTLRGNDKRVITLTGSAVISPAKRPLPEVPGMAAEEAGALGHDHLPMLRAEAANMALTMAALSELEKTTMRWLKLDHDRATAQAELEDEAVGRFIVRSSRVKGALVLTQRVGRRSRPSGGAPILKSAQDYVQKEFVNVLIVKTPVGYKWASVDAGIHPSPLNQLLAQAAADAVIRQRIGIPRP